jgi:serine/threonine protein kinase
MGEVYRARELKLKREVALKILPDDFARDPERLSSNPEAKARFEREAKTSC